MDDRDYSVLTVDDYEGYEHHYHAFILYADEDQVFVDELREKFGNMLQICTKDKLLPRFAAEYGPVAHLISHRCTYLILVCSPDFISSPASDFFRDYAQAINNEPEQRNLHHKLIPIMYKDCQLPVTLMYYHRLYYMKEGNTMHNFWEKLRRTLTQNRVV